MQYFAARLETTATVLTATKDRSNISTVYLERKVDQDTLRIFLDDFIKVFILCRNCSLPETRLEAQSSKLLSMSCNCCGAKNSIEDQFEFSELIKISEESSKGGYPSQQASDSIRINFVKLSYLRYLSQDKINKFNLLKVRVQTLKVRELTPDFQLLDELIIFLKEVIEDLQKKQKTKEETDSLCLTAELIRDLQLGKGQQDRIDYILFGVIFGEKIASKSTIQQRGHLFKSLFEKLNRTEFLQPAIILNLQHLIFWKHAHEIDLNLIGTILFYFYEQGLLEREFLTQWKESDEDEVRCQHFLYQKRNNRKLKEKSVEFLDWVLNDSSSEEESDDSPPQCN